MASIENLGTTPERCSGDWVDYECSTCGYSWAVKVGDDGAPLDVRKTECPTAGCDGLGRAR